MNYRHAYHAGNFADVLKHAALIAALLHLRKKEAPFAVFDTHAGRGLYDLTGAEAVQTGEAHDGIGRLPAPPEDADLPSVLRDYTSIAYQFGIGRYPGSPLIAARLLRAQDRLIAVEKHPAEFAALAAALLGYDRARAIAGDGYMVLPQLLPPPERRGLVLIDPPYEEAHEFEQATRAALGVWRRFATGIVMLWYPAKRNAEVEAMIGEFLNAGIRRLLRVELDIGQPAGKGARDPLRAAGLLVINPPFGFDAKMRNLCPHLARLLGKPGTAKWRTEHLAA